MNELRTLPKNYVVLIFIAGLLVVTLAISIGLLLVGGVVFYLYLENYPTSNIITYGAIAWIIYILLLVGVLYYNKIRIKKKQARLIHLIQAEFFATFALRSLNMMLRKWQRKHDGS
jgi:hypothetical protein